MKSRSRFHYIPTIALLGTVALGGCGGIHYPTRYMLNFPTSAPRIPQIQQDPLGPLEVREFRCPAYLCEGRIVYRPSPEEVGYYEYHRWALSPRQAITSLMADALRTQSLFKTVSFHEPGIQTAYVLSGSIDSLEEVDEARDIRAVCTISAQLLDARKGSVVWNHTASESVSVESRNVDGVVSSLAAAASATVDRLVESMATALASARYPDPQP